MYLLPPLFRRLLWVLPIAIFLAPPAPGDELRTWTSANGNSRIKGEAIKYMGSDVTILTDSKKTIKIKTDQLSVPDRVWLEANKTSIGKSESPSSDNAPGSISDVAQQFSGSTSIISRSGKAKKEEVKPNAKYYLILFSASWCGPCRAEMPTIVKEYNRKIKNNPDLELIHKSADKGIEDALAWGKQEKIPFPTVLPGATCQASVLGLREGGGIPSLMVITASGEKVVEDHPSRLLKSYHKEIEKYEAAKGDKNNK